MTYYYCQFQKGKSYLFIVYLEVIIILFSYVCNHQKAKTHGKDRLFAFIPTSAVRR